MGLKAMKIYIKVIITVLLMTISTTVSAGSVWDGSVSTARYGYLPQTGLYAASNAFPQNTLVTVTNPETGKSVDVTVLERLEDNTVFLALSADAADAVGITYGDLFYGQISEQNKKSGADENDLPYNPDPDINPSAASEDYTELAVIQNYIDNELGGTDSTILNNPGIDKPVENIPQADLPAEEAAAVEPAAGITASPNNSEALPAAPEESISKKEDIPSIENMPMEDVYISNPKEELPVPDVLENKEPSVSTPVAEQVEDIPVLVGMDAFAPVLVTLSNPGTELPEIPVPDSDKPVVSLLSVEPAENNQQPGIDVFPELPIIGIEDMSEETPPAVTLMYDVAPVEQDNAITPTLPQISEKEQVSDKPEVSSVDTPNPVIEGGTELAELEPAIVRPEKAGSIPENVEIILEPSEARPPVVEEVVEVPSVPDTVRAEPVAAPVEEPELAEAAEPEKAAETEIAETAEPVKAVETIKEPAATEVDANSYNVTKALSKGSYYLQLGVYREEYSALALAGRLGSTYPVTVLVAEGADFPKYKVMVGPLGADESGVVLYSFKSRGYPDAFLRKGL